MRWASILLAALCACGDDFVSIRPVSPPQELPCELDEAVRRFEVFFVLDVSGSMTPFLETLASTLSALAVSFPVENRRGDRVLVSYRVVGFVNDVRLFPPGAERMTSHIAVSDAIREGIAAGRGNRNLNANTPNSDADENLLDALSAVLAQSEGAQAVLALVATDAGFREAPATLSGGITVRSTYPEILSGLQNREVRVHAFVPGPLDGLTRPFRGQPPLTSLPGGRVYDLDALGGANDLIETTLAGIAIDATCPSPPEP